MSSLFKNKPIEKINILSNEKTTPEDEKIFRKYIAKIYKNRKYKVWNHTDDTGENDRGINIIVKKNREIILIHCHLSTTDITTEDLKEFEKQRDKFILENPLFEDYDISLRYTLTGFFMTENAFWYMNEHTKIISYEIKKPN
jgi:hypothetical protein